MEPEKTGSTTAPTGTPTQTTPVTPTSDPVSPISTTTPTTPSVPVTPTTPVAPTTPTTPATPEPALSKEQVSSITENVSGEVSKSVLQKISDALGITKKEDTLPTNTTQLKELVDSEIGKRFNKEDKEAKKQEKQDVVERQGRIDNTIKGWHFQYNELAKIGKMPVIKNAVDKNDEGVIARRKLITAVGKIIDEVRQSDPNSEHIPSISEAFIRFPNVLKGVPGEDLPISGNTTVRETTDSFSYEKDVAGKSFQQIVDSAN